MTTRDWIDAARQRADAATPGAWDAEGCYGDLEGDEVRVTAGSARTVWDDALGSTPGSYQSTDEVLRRDVDSLWTDAHTPGPDVEQVWADTTFIAAARTDLPRALNALDAVLAHADEWDATPEGRDKATALRERINLALTADETDRG